MGGGQRGGGGFDLFAAPPDRGYDFDQQQQKQRQQSDRMSNNYNDGRENDYGRSNQRPPSTQPYYMNQGDPNDFYNPHRTRDWDAEGYPEVANKQARAHAALTKGAFYQQQQPILPTDNAGSPEWNLRNWEFPDRNRDYY
mmetsp:Transcript_46165/g.108782  ORF Transcript_46165/g.108782 Transcript_46165/m.108782 type:complete len:140 (-) Transcript_46165:38-457(-)